MKHVAGESLVRGLSATIADAANNTESPSGDSVTTKLSTQSNYSGDSVTTPKRCWPSFPPAGSNIHVVAESLVRGLSATIADVPNKTESPSGDSKSFGDLVIG